MDRIGEIDGVYHLDPAHSALGFTVRHAGLSRVRGTFDLCHGYAIIDSENVHDSAVMVRISAATINTMVPDRDAHLRSADFLDVEKFPAVTYVGTDFEILDEEHVRVAGDLTITDVTRPVELVLTFTGGATDPFGNRRIGFEGQVSISRKDFGLTWNAALETGGWLVADKVDLDIDVSTVQQAGQDEELTVDQAAIADLALAPTADAMAVALDAIADDTEPSVPASAVAAVSQPVDVQPSTPDSADPSMPGRADPSTQRHGLSRGVDAGAVGSSGSSRPRRAALEEEPAEVTPTRGEEGPRGWWKRFGL